ncbi:MAG: DNA starvation/stationary phase protection protein Dps [Dehalococcoidia bacterium]
MTTAQSPRTAKHKEARAFRTRNSLSQATREHMIMLLNQHLADSSDLYSQTKQAHWNVRGPEFIQLHELFDELAGSVLGYVDMIAERATALGGEAAGTVRMAAGGSRLPEYPADLRRGLQHVEALADRYGDYANATRQAIDEAAAAGDMDTSDLFTEISRGVDKHLWFLEAHLQKE